MKIKFSTSDISKIIDTNLYESEYSEWCEESWEEIYPDVLESAEYVLEDIFEDVGLNVKMSNFKIWNPSEFNNLGTSVDFELEFNEFELKKKIGEEIQKDKTTYIEGLPNMNNFIMWLRKEYGAKYGYYKTIKETIMKFKSVFDYKPRYSWEHPTEIDEVIWLYVEWFLQDCGKEYQDRYDDYMHQSEVFCRYLDREGNYE